MVNILNTNPVKCTHAPPWQMFTLSELIMCVKFEQSKLKEALKKTIKTDIVYFVHLVQIHQILKSLCLTFVFYLFHLFNFFFLNITMLAVSLTLIFYQLLVKLIFLKQYDSASKLVTHLLSFASLSFHIWD